MSNPHVVLIFNTQWLHTCHTDWALPYCQQVYLINSLWALGRKQEWCLGREQHFCGTPYSCKCSPLYCRGAALVCPCSQPQQWRAASSSAHKTQLGSSFLFEITLGKIGSRWGFCYRCKSQESKCPSSVQQDQQPFLGCFRVPLSPLGFFHLPCVGSRDCAIARG